MPSIFILRDEQFHEAAEEPYEAEDILQQLVAQYPSLLAGGLGQEEKEARRWLLLKREVSITGPSTGARSWSADHLLLDQDAVPTIVEVKRGSDTRIRREVVGQMLEYAANAYTSWSIEKLKANFAATCRDEGKNEISSLCSFLGEGTNEPGEEHLEKFWERAAANLAAVKMRLIFLSDSIPPELQRIVEFLNEQMRATDVIAIEVKRYRGDGVTALVPRSVGETMKARSAKVISNTESWTRDELLNELAEQHGDSIMGVADKILDFCELHLPHWWWGTGQQMGSVFVGMKRGEAKWFPCSLTTRGQIVLQFRWLKKRPPFDDLSRREELLKRMNAIPDVQVSTGALERLPTFPMASLLEPVALKAFLAALQWFVEEIHQSHE